MKLKIVFLVTEAGYFISHRLPIALALLKKGHSVTILTKAENSSQLGSLGFDVYPLRFINRSNCTLLKEIQAFWEILFLYKKLTPHVVHQVAMKPVLYGTIAARLTKTPHIINALAGLGYVFISDSLKAKLLRFFIIRFFFFLFKNPKTHLIVQNQDDAKLFCELIPKAHIHLIKGSGVDINAYAPGKNRIPPSPLKIVLVARLLWDKGIGEAIAAIQTLKQKGLQIKFVLAGGIDKENPSAIAEHIVKQWVQKGLCEWLGEVKNVAAIYRQSHIAILPSYREGLPKSLLEAAASGLPLVATDVPGCREIVIPNKNGFLVPKKDTPSLAAAIEKLCLSSDLRQQFGDYSRNLVIKNFSEEIIVKETLSLYEKVTV